MGINTHVKKWKIGFHTWTFASLPLEAALKHIKNAGFTEVEINADKIHLDPRVFPRSKLPHLRKLLSELGLHPNSVHAPIDGVNLSAQDYDIKKRSIDLLTETLEYCRAIECPIMVMHPNHSESLSLGFEVMKRNSIEAIREVVKKAEELEVKIAIENMINVKGGRFGSKISELREIIKNVDSPYLGICLDTGHINLLTGSDADLEKEITRAGEYLWTLHVHDNDGKADRHWPPGEGNIDWNKVVRSLREVGYKGVFMMEIYGEGDVDKLARECLRRASEMLSAG